MKPLLPRLTLALVLVVSCGQNSCTITKTLVSPFTGPVLFIKKFNKRGFHPSHLLLYLHALPFVIAWSPIEGLYNGARSDYYVLTGDARNGATRHWWRSMKTNRSDRRRDNEDSDR